MLNLKSIAPALIIISIVSTSSGVVLAQETAQAPAATAQETAPVAKPGLFATLKAKFAGPVGFGPALSPAIFAEIDADKSGSLSQAEIDSFRAAKLANFDTTKDGSINLDEFSVAYAELMRSRMVDAFQRLDDDGNGTITTAEIDSRFGAIVATLDRNGDGLLSAEDRPAKGGKHRHDRDQNGRDQN